MKTYLCQHVQRWNRKAAVYEPIAVLVLDRGVPIPIPIGVGSVEWATTFALDARHWQGTGRALMNHKFDQNSTLFAYSQPVKIAANNPEHAANKLHARLQRELDR